MNDRSLEQINITKLVLYSLVFICLCGGLIMFLIMPILQDYKSSMAELSSQNGINYAVNESFQESLERVQGLEKDNKELLTQFDADFNKTHLVGFLENYFFEPVLSEIKHKKKSEYLLGEFNVSAVMDNPKIFYRFIEDLKSYQSLIKLETPIDLRSRDDGEIDIKFIIKVFSSRF